MPVAIAGMHRSGTSMVARLLNLCGLYLGEEKDLTAAAEDNQEGYWEHVKFRSVNERILAAFNGSWDVPPALKDGWEKSPRLIDVRTTASNTIRHFLPYRAWGWKDPRTSLTLPFWKELLPNLKTVICLRNPFEVYGSLARRGYASSLFSYQLWTVYYQQLLASTKPEERIVTHYDTFFYNTEAELQRLVDFLGLDTPRNVIQEACRAVFIDLRHNHATIENIRKTNAPQHLLKMYRDLCFQAGPVYQLSLSPEEQVDLRGIRVTAGASLEDYKILLRIAKKESEQKDKQILDLTQKLAKEEAKFETYEQQLIEAKEQICSLQEQMKQICESHSWRLITVLQRIRQYIAPYNSRREKVLKDVFRFLNAVLIRPLRKVYTFVRKVLSVLRREGAKGVFVRVRQRAKIDLQYQPSKKTVADVYNDLLDVASARLGSEYVPLSDEGVSAKASPVKMVAFYLPQFHPIPENDLWWGKGFTEWTNVSKALPQFAGHYQPHLPGELGFYDLRVPDTQKRQIELAKHYGIYGFAFYYYWFHGKRLLERPLDLFLKSKEDFHFCICWANENWTRRWDGQEDDILIAQEHSPESDLKFIQDVSPILRDERYIRINGRPLLMVYRANLLTNASQTAEVWRDYCLSHDIGNPYLVAAQTFWFTNPHDVGFDAALEFPPHNIAMTSITHLLRLLNPDYDGRVVNYQEVIEKATNTPKTAYKVFKTVFPGWDNEARKPGRGYTFAFSTPELYKQWLLRTAEITMQEQNLEKRLLFINAWNEWAEGAHLEPDRRYGYAYLQATAEVVKELSGKEIKLRTGM